MGRWERCIGGTLFVVHAVCKRCLRGGWACTDAGDRSTRKLRLLSMRASCVL